MVVKKLNTGFVYCCAWGLVFLLSASFFEIKAPVGLKRSLDVKTSSVHGPSTPHYYLFSYFLRQDRGMCYAISTDGNSWTPLNQAKPFLVPQVGMKLLRDPSICRSPDGLYHLVWTTSWSGTEFGYSSSTDLIHWSHQQALALMKNIPGTVNCWAPEIFYDKKKKEFIVYWSSTISTNGVYADGKNYIYFSTTTDFKKFSTPEILFSNGLSGGGNKGNQGVIDAYIFQKSTSEYVLFYKKDDNTGVANLFYRFASDPLGEWGQEQGPILPSTGDEGPSCLMIGDEYRVYTDPAESHFAYIFITKDFKTWKRMRSNLKMSHGSVIEIPDSLALHLLNKTALK